MWRSCKLKAKLNTLCHQTWNICIWHLGFSSMMMVMKRRFPKVFTQSIFSVMFPAVSQYLDEFYPLIMFITRLFVCDWLMTTRENFLSVTLMNFWFGLIHVHPLNYTVWTLWSSVSSCSSFCFHSHLFNVSPINLTGFKVLGKASLGQSATCSDKFCWFCQIKRFTKLQFTRTILMKVFQLIPSPVRAWRCRPPPT